MADTKPGAIIWTDLTIPNADFIRDFYEAVVGWKASPLNGDYEMCDPETGQPVAGVCHAMGVNAELPPQWLIYVAVADLEQSLKQCTQRGGKIITRHSAKYCVIEDPAGAVMMLCQAQRTV